MYIGRLWSDSGGEEENGGHHEENAGERRRKLDPVKEVMDLSES